MLSNINPILKNNQQAFDKMMSDPDSFDSEYGLPPLSPHQKVELEKTDISELGNASVGEILYKTSLNSKLRLPGDSGFDEWNISNTVRRAALEQINNASSVDEMSNLLSTPIDTSRIREIECGKSGGIFLNTKTHELQSGYDRCMARDDGYSYGM